MTFIRIFVILIFICTNKSIGESIIENVNNSSSINKTDNFIIETYLTNCDDKLENNNNNNCYNVSKLNLSSIGLTIYPYMLTNGWFPSLKYLNLSKNQIKNLSQSDFQSILSKSSLEILDLSYNQLIMIDEDTFKNLVSLKYLNLSNNQIKSLNMFAFACDEHNLIELDLSFNSITDSSMEFLLFSSLTKLKLLNMNSNKLTTLSNHLLYNLHSLETLLLNNNNLKSFDLVRLNQNNQFLRLIDLSYNLNLKFDNQDNFNNNFESKKYINNVESLNLAGIDMVGINMNRFLDFLFENYKNLRYLNMSMTRTKMVWSENWPHNIKIIDLSYNFIKDAQFDCGQFRSIQLEYIYLNNNHLKNFKIFVNNCSSLLNNSSVLIDLRNNLFESIDSIYSNSTTSELNNDFEMNQLCKNEQSLSGLLLKGNPLICDCDDNSWWSNIYSSNLNNSTIFSVDKQFCLTIRDYEELNCVSMSPSKIKMFNKIDLSEINDNIDSYIRPSLMKFDSIRSDIIKPKLICPYRYSCSSSSCECCGFRACDCSFSCPHQCRCSRNFEHSFDMINCTNVYLNTIPTNLPEMATDVFLDNNNLKRISPHQFFGRFYIRKIDLTNNQLAFIEENAFNGLSQLRILKLSHNNLQILLGYEFRDLFQLEELYLDSNNIQFVSNLTFTYLINLRYLNLQFNNLRHTMEFKIYFLYNTNLLNLTLDSSLSDSNNNLPKPVNNLIIKSIQNKKSLKFSNSTSINLTYLNLITQLLQQTKLNSNINYGVLIRCLFDKFKETTSNSIININSQINDKNLKLVFLDNFENFKLSCLKKNETFHDISYMKQVADESQYYYNNNLEISLSKQRIKNNNQNSNSNTIVLNYSTIIWLSLILIILIILISILLSYLIIKIQNSKNVHNTELYDLDKTSSNSTDCLNQTSNIIVSVRKKFTKMLNRITNKKINEKSVIDFNNVENGKEMMSIKYEDIKYKECSTGDTAIENKLNKKRASFNTQHKSCDQRLDIKKKLKSNRYKNRYSYSSNSSFKSSNSNNIEVIVNKNEQNKLITNESTRNLF